MVYILPPPHPDEPYFFAPEPQHYVFDKAAGLLRLFHDDGRDLGVEIPVQYPWPFTNEERPRMSEQTWAEIVEWLLEQDQLPF